MSSNEHHLLTYLALAAAAHQKQQWPGRDRFLVIAAHFAIQEGLIEIAEDCRQIVIRDEPHHLFAKAETVAEVARSETFPVLVKQLLRHCPPERAEQLAENVELRPPDRDGELTSEEVLEAAMVLLRAMHGAGDS